MPEWVLIIITVVSLNGAGDYRHLRLEWFDTLEQCNEAKVEHFDPSGRDVIFMRCLRYEDLAI